MSTNAEGVFVIASAMLVLISALLTPEISVLVCLIMLTAITAMNSRTKEL